MTRNEKETTMTTYTEQDFANAEFARHPDGVVAARVDDGSSVPWYTADDSWRTDDRMALDGWVPVREAPAQPITLDALQAAWEGAEQGHATKGDVVIRRAYDGEDFAVWVSVGSGWTEDDTRILRRAPKPKRPEGAEKLSLLIQQAREASEWADDADAWADWLAERGVRATGEGDG